MSKNLCRVLAVDDQENWRDLVQAILEDDGCQVSSAGSYAEATQMLSHILFDIAILDMRLEDSQQYNVQGLKLLQQVKQINPNTKAIVLTGYPNPEQMNKALDTFQADAYLEKAPAKGSFDIDRFSHLIEEFVDQSVLVRKK